MKKDSFISDKLNRTYPIFASEILERSN